MNPVFPFILTTVFGSTLTVIALALAAIDFRRMVLPDWLNLALMGTGVAQGLMLGRPGLIDGAIGSLLGVGLLSSLAFVFRKWRGADGLGLGDQKFVAAAGFWTGWQQLPIMLLVASVSALVFVLLCSVATRSFDPTSRLPFGPFLALATCVAWGVGLLAA